MWLLMSSSGLRVREEFLVALLMIGLNNGCKQPVNDNIHNCKTNN